MPADVLFGSLRPTVVAVVAVCAAPAVGFCACSTSPVVTAVPTPGLLPIWMGSLLMLQMTV